MNKPHASFRSLSASLVIAVVALGVVDAPAFAVQNAVTPSTNDSTVPTAGPMWTDRSASAKRR